ncbi:hypothetical protein [Lactobacillus intestinalis]|uniref:hypothetical protein n=1 Tax=Lactobacillus intestinalis TaxID=151781 RepID=UPI00242D2335|nr:hypothetical protein [Lactobacillus intestinalis]
MFYRHRKTHRVLEAVSSIGLLIFGFTVLLLWLFNMPLFIKMVVYVTTLYYLFQIFNHLKIFQKFDNFTFQPWQQILLVLVGIIEFALLIYFQSKDITVFLYLAGGYTGVYFTYGLTNDLLILYQFISNYIFRVKDFLWIAFITTLSTAVLLTTLSIVGWLPFAIIVISLGILYSISDLLVEHFSEKLGRNEMGYMINFAEKNRKSK